MTLVVFVYDLPMGARRVVCFSALASGLGAVLAFAACSGGGGGGASDDDAGPTGVIDGGPRIDATTDGTPPDPLAPPGWASYPSHDPDCPLYLPSSAAALPAPLAWAACATTLPPSVVCEQASFAGADAYGFSGWHHDKTVTLGVSQWGFAPGYTGVVDVDGPVHRATYFASGECYTDMMNVNDGKFVEAIIDTRNGTSYHGGGFVAGSIDALVPERDVSFSPSDKADHFPIVSKTFGVLDTYYDKFTPDGPWYRLYPWGEDASAPLPPPGSALFAGSALLWSDGVSVSVVPTPGATRQPFLPTNPDAGDGVDWFTSDDTQMLWLDQANVPEAGLVAYADASLMVAPLTSDRTKIAARRVAGESGELGGYVIGCGYAARNYRDSDTNATGLRVERLSDGRSWQIEDLPTWYWSQPVGISCTHVIANAGRPGPMKNSGAKFVLARLRLDSLGPGSPPN